MTNKTTKGAVRLISALALAAGLGTSAMAEEITSIAILTPETGTDFGWNQQGIDGAKAAGDALGVEVIVAENLGYGDVRPTLRELSEEEPGLIIAHASGYNTAAPEIGTEAGVKVAIVDSPSALTEGAVVDYTASGHEGAYLAGVLAAKMTRSGTVGIVTSGEPPSWNSQSAAFAEGVKAANPDLVIRYAVIGPAAYSDAAGGKRVTESLIAAGADIIFGQGNGSSFGMLQAVETTPAADGGKVMFIDVIGDKTPIDKGYLLSSVLWNLTPVYEAMIEDIRADKFGTRNYDINLADGSVALLKSPQIPDDVWAEVMEVQDEIIAGSLVIEPKFDADSVHALVTGE
ncbi:putative B6 ABC transporter substrate-binding protein [Celeribacter litoreus]|uniref:putative B6 ABC transporter substrate-binding protein n=1 Tax=Celeribacter litoreus TaxID=2876714 RepID=UPI001CCA3638|nr:BMP family protein [Celeribacter litoreus]MCA0042477.1 BMP family protein [Celeribacter litoreus]